MKFKKIVSLFAAATMAVSSFAGLGVTASAKQTQATVDTIYHADEIFPSSGGTEAITVDSSKAIYYNDTLGAPFGEFSEITSTKFSKQTGVGGADKAAYIDGADGSGSVLNYDLATEGTYTLSVLVVEYNKRYPNVYVDDAETPIIDGASISGLEKIGAYGSSRGLAVIQAKLENLPAGPHSIKFTTPSSSDKRVQGVIAAVLNGEAGPLPSISLDASKKTISLGDSFDLAATIENADGVEINWTSSDTGIAEVNDNGQVTGLAPGNATITAMINVDGAEYEATCEVTVVDLGDDISVILKYSSSDLANGDNHDIKTDFIFVDGVDENIKSFFADLSDSTKIARTLVSNKKDYISGTASNGSHPVLTTSLPAGTYKMYYLGYNHGQNITASFASTGETITAGTGVNFAYDSADANYVLKVYTLEFTLDKAVTDEKITFNSTQQWLPDMYAIVITNQEVAPKIEAATTVITAEEMTPVGANNSNPSLYKNYIPSDPTEAYATYQDIFGENFSKAGVNKYGYLGDGKRGHVETTFTTTADGPCTLYVLASNPRNDNKITVTDSNDNAIVNSVTPVGSAKVGTNGQDLCVYTVEIVNLPAGTYTFKWHADNQASDLVALGITHAVSSEEPDPEPTPEPAVGAYSATWDFQRNNKAPDIALEGSAPYSYADTTGAHTLVVDTKTNGGKLNNANWGDWAQCTDGTTFIIPAYKGMKLTWDCYNNSTASVVVDGSNSVGEYIYTGDGNTLTISTSGFDYLRTFTVTPVTVYAAAGTVTGVDAGTLTGTAISFAASNGQTFTGTIGADNTYAVELPEGTYTVLLISDNYYIPSSSVTVNSETLPAIAVAESLTVAVSGSVANPPAEEYTLTFTSLAGSATSIKVAAGAESYNVNLSSGSYTITSPNGKLSNLSIESFDVATTAVEKNIYFPEDYTAPADMTNITVGTGQQYKTIRDALGSIKAARDSGNKDRATIVLKAGETFREPVDVTSNDVTITSDASNPAKITWYYGSDYEYYSINASGRYDIDRVMTKVKTYSGATDNRYGSTLRVGGTGFICENVIVENSFNQYVTNEELADGVKGSYNREKDKTVNVYEATTQAAAITIDRDNCVLYNCEFIGSQDTFYTNTNNTYVKDCIIRGQTDYIYGGGKVLFDDCQLVWSGFDNEARAGYVTAGSGKAGEMYIFRDCTIKYSDDTSRQYTPGKYGRTWQNAPTVYFLNCTDEDNCVNGWSPMGIGVYEVSTLGVYNFTDSSYNTPENAQNTNLAFDTAAEIYENVLTTIFNGNAPKHFANAKTKTKALSDAAEDRKDTDGTYVYGVVTEIKAGESAAITGVKWTVKANDSTYSFSTNDNVDGKDMLHKGTFPTISGDGTAEVAMLFHAPQGTYEVVSQAE